MSGPGTEAEIKMIIEKLQKMIKEATNCPFNFSFTVKNSKIFLEVPRGFTFFTELNGEEKYMKEEFYGKNFYEAGKSFIDFFSANSNIKGIITADEDGFQFKTVFSLNKGKWIATGNSGRYCYTDSFDD